MTKRTLTPIKVKEFKLLLNGSLASTLVANELQDGRYSLIVIDRSGEVEQAYFVREYRTNVARTWRLDRLIVFLKSCGQYKLEVRCNYA